MTALESVDAAGWLRQQATEGNPDVLRTLITTFANALMSAEADAVCGAEYGQRSDERTNRRNGYRNREWDTRAGTVELAIPKLRQGSYFPDWLLEHRRRAEQALVTVVATSYLLGVSTRRVEKLAEQLGVTRLSKSQVSEMAQVLDAQVEAFRGRPLDSAHYTFVSLDALTMKVREDGRTVNVACLIAVGVNADGHREVLGLDVCAEEDGAGWLALSSRPWTASCPPSPPTWRPPGPTSWPSPPSRRRSGGRSGPTTPRNGSTGRSAAAPTSSAFSPPATPSSAWSAPSWPNSTTNGPRCAATSAWTSSPRAAPAPPPSPAHPRRSRSPR